MTLMFAFMLAVTATVGGTTKVTSANTYYDRKEGYAHFSGNVYVEGTDYQLHADRAYVFMDATNELHRIVAMGNVAMTNGARRAYGAKLSYYRNPGLIVLTAEGGGKSAELREETQNGPQIVRGVKIKYWTDVNQAEVVESELSAPTKGGTLDEFQVGEVK